MTANAFFLVLVVSWLATFVVLLLLVEVIA
jgi:hypothetical protein